MGSDIVQFRSLALLVLTVLVMGTVPAVAVPELDGEGESKAEQLGDGGRVESTVRLRGAKQPSSRSDGDNRGRVTSSNNRYSYYWRPATAPPLNCPRGDFEWREQVRYDRISDVETVVGPGRCVDLAAEAKSRRIAALPPPPAPTVAELVAIARVKISPQPVTVSPDHGGITGMQTWFWYEGPQEVTVAATIRGYATTATMRPTTYSWNPCSSYTPPDDKPRTRPRGCRTVSSTTPGREPPADSNGDQAAARFTYETKGTYDISMTVVWEGTWRFSGHGASASGELATVRVTSTRTYPVEEIRAVLVG